MSASKYIDRRLTTVAVLLTITISKWVCTKFFSGDRKTFQKMNSEIQNMNHKKISLSVFTQKINSPNAPLFGHLLIMPSPENRWLCIFWSIKIIEILFSVQKNLLYRSISTSPVTMQKTFLEITICFRVSLFYFQYRYFN